MLLSGLHQAPSVVQSGGEWREEGEDGRPSLGEIAPSIAHVHQQGVGRLRSNLDLDNFALF